ncbi:MAG: hypothetical protein HRT72_13885, partial [Flavobacteriales bacterium]|nr:hypothetical protein [Flavobacteriales bacterium]
MSFNIGDRVQFVNEDDEGVIENILPGDKFLVSSSMGFDIEVDGANLILQ